MNKETISDFIEVNQHDGDKDTVLIDGHESAFVGYIRRENGLSAVYSYDKIIDNLMNDNMTYEDAVEFYDYNIDRGISYLSDGVKPTIMHAYSY
jgi:hypothetical protein